jgi:hypothetical protein
MKQKVSTGLIAAGLFNILGVLIILWGSCYIAMAPRYQAAPEIMVVFALEKFFYFASWCWWQWNNFLELPSIWAENPMAAAFYFAYGPGDLAFGFFFLALFFQAKRR